MAPALSRKRGHGKKRGNETVKTGMKHLCRLPEHGGDRLPAGQAALPASARSQARRLVQAEARPPRNVIVSVSSRQARIFQKPVVSAEPWPWTTGWHPRSAPPIAQVDSSNASRIWRARSSERIRTAFSLLNVTHRSLVLDWGVIVWKKHQSIASRETGLLDKKDWR
jgi:hypothetical protein